MATMDDLLAELENLGAVGEAVEKKVVPVAVAAPPTAPVAASEEEDSDDVSEGLTEDELASVFSADYTLPSDEAEDVEDDEEDDEEDAPSAEVAEAEIDVEDVVERLRAVEREVRSLIRILSGG
jgi:hypothetical protein